MQFKHSIGNKKIGKDTLIFNMGSATHCPSKLKGLCDIDCYAKKAEVQYPAVLPARDHQEQYWLKTSASTIVNDIKKVVKSKRTPIKYVRVNEAGDLHSEACLHKLIMIAEALPDLKFYTYTHRQDLIDDNTHNFMPSNLVLNTSNFKRQGLNQFKAVRVETKFRSYQAKAKEIKAELKTISKSNFNCGGDCSKCSLCKVNHSKDIFVAYH
jgi:hypothetical protein